MVLIPKHHATAVIDWLDAEVSPNQPYRVPDIERTEDSRRNPYHDNTTAQIAEWRQSTPDGWKRSPETEEQWQRVRTWK